MLMTTRRPGAVYSGIYTRKPVHGVVGFMMSCAAAVLLLWMMIHLFEQDVVPTSSKQMAAGLFLVACVLLYIGTTWFFSFITGDMRKLVIAESGIVYGLARFSWPQVAKIDVGIKHSSFQVRIVLERGWLASRWLITDDGMNRAMAEEFIEALRLQILPRFPHLEIAKIHGADRASTVTAVPAGVPFQTQP